MSLGGKCGGRRQAAAGLSLGTLSQGRWQNEVTSLKCPAGSTKKALGDLGILLEESFLFAHLLLRVNEEYFFISNSKPQGRETTDLEKTHISPLVFGHFHTIRTYTHFIL